MKPVLGAAPPPKAGRPQPGRVPEKERWVFSFRFWRQIENFQIGDLKPSWYISLLQRLADVSAIDRDELFRDTGLQDGLRFHEINWGSKNVPIARNDLDWLAKDYLDNEAEFPFYQFHVSKALGRIVGFFDERQIFNIVLLDPNHNIQPSNYNDYKIRPTVAGSCQFSQVVTVARSYVGGCTNSDCAVKHGIVEAIEVETRNLTGGVMVVNLTDETSSRLGRIVGAGAANTIDELMEYAIGEFESMLPSEQA
jgi:hypothetical protein